MRGLYKDTLLYFSLISAQDYDSARYLTDLGAHEVQVQNPLKQAAEPLWAEPEALVAFGKALVGRKVWVAASTHEQDEEVVIAAQVRLAAGDPAFMLILVPRKPDRAPRIAASLRRTGLRFTLRSQNLMPGPDSQVLLADSFGELGLWYRLASQAFIGASFGGLGGHNPWEAVCVGTPVVSGPDTCNFDSDYKRLISAGLAQRVEPSEDAASELARVIRSRSHFRVQERAKQLFDAAQVAIKPLANELIALIGSET